MISRILLNFKVHYRLYHSIPLLILSEVNPVHVNILFLIDPRLYYPHIQVNVFRVFPLSHDSPPYFCMRPSSHSHL